MREKHVLIVVAVPVSAQHGRNFRSRIIVAVTFGVYDVVVVGDSAVFSHFLVVERAEKMGFVALAEITAVERVVEMRSALRIVVSASVNIVEIEAESESFIDIDAEFCREMVFAVQAVAASVVSEVGDGRERVGEVEILRSFDEKIVGLGENELSVGLSVDENSVDAR